MDKQVAQKKNLTKDEFKSQLTLTKVKLPKGYGQVLQYLHPDIDMTKVYNVVHGKVHDEDILEKLKEIVKNQN